MASESSRLVYTQIINLALGAKLDHPNMQTATGGFVREAHLAPPRPSTPLNDDSVAALAAAPKNGQSKFYASGCLELLLLTDT